MPKSKPFWYGNMAGAIFGWGFVLLGLIVPLTGLIHTLWIVIALLWIAGHPLELIAALPIAKKAGYTPGKTVINTLVFGITWWIPVKLGVFQPDST
ncbi:MAG: hypothetical protein SWH61_12065 [Thermodesulfobacteriota bacterium]|nr:hypothetical protein [Thermodesulfobacteriota bacterium]